MLIKSLNNQIVLKRIPPCDSWFVRSILDCSSRPVWAIVPHLAEIMFKAELIQIYSLNEQKHDTQNQ